MSTLIEGANIGTLSVSSDGFQEIDARDYCQLVGKIAGKFEFVSKEELDKSLEDLFNSDSKLLTNEENFNDDGSGMHGPIVKCFVANATPKLPRRATKGSAGYDFYAPFTFTLLPGETIKIPTGIKCRMNLGWVLKLYPRSSLGTKYMLVPRNLTPIIDSDYFCSDNEGHIFIKMVNMGNKFVCLKQGDAFLQGIFVEYGITVDDEVTEIRNGGFGSTSERKE